jgi:hypothetical protein
MSAMRHVGRNGRARRPAEPMRLTRNMNRPSVSACSIQPPAAHPEGSPYRRLLACGTRGSSPAGRSSAFATKLRRDMSTIPALQFDCSTSCALDLLPPGSKPNIFRRFGCTSRCTSTLTSDVPSFPNRTSSSLPNPELRTPSVLQPLTCNLQPATFNLQPSTFNL